jgi:hypothetical protein
MVPAAAVQWGIPSNGYMCSNTAAAVTNACGGQTAQVATPALGSYVATTYRVSTAPRCTAHANAHARLACEHHLNIAVKSSRFGCHSMFAIMNTNCVPEERE